jgi:GH15 family glucan-1,4-alpha-glucosidase
MCWVALDRALRLAFRRSFPADRSRWLQCRDEIYQAILDQGWNPERRSFVQSYGSTALDSACLVMPLVFFMSPSDPMMLDTIKAVARPLNQGGLMSGGGVYRYAPERTDDGLPGDEGMFNMCTFWLVEALTRASRADPSRLREARLLFEKMLGLSNHLGLYSEESSVCGEALGNSPQAFTHMGLISAAFNLDRALGNATA